MGHPLLELFLGVVVEGEEQALEGWVQGGGEQRGEDGCGDEPDDDRVPLPGPEQVGGGPRALAHEAENGVGGDGRRAGAEEDLSGAKIDHQQREFEREEQVVGDLAGDNVEPEDEGGGEAEHGGRADDRVDADGGSDRERPGEAARGSSHAQEMEQREDDAILKEAPDAACGCGSKVRCERGGH